MYRCFLAPPAQGERFGRSDASSAPSHSTRELYSSWLMLSGTHVFPNSQLPRSSPRSHWQRRLEDQLPARGFGGTELRRFSLKAPSEIPVPENVHRVAAFLARKARSGEGGPS